MTSVAEVLLHPAGLSAVLFLLLLVGMRWRFPFTVAGGGLLLVGVAGAAFVLWDTSSEVVRRAVRLDVAPAVALALAAMFATWASVRDLRHRPPGRRSSTWEGPGDRDLLVGSVVLVVLVVVAFLSPPAVGPFDDGLGLAQPPWWAAGWMELSGLVHPPLLFAILSLLGLAAIPWLSADPVEAGEHARDALEERRYGVRLFLFGWWVLGIAPMVLGAWMRDAEGRRLGLDGSPMESLHWSRSLAEWWWLEVLRVGLPTSPWVREMPGLLLLALLVVGVPLVAMIHPAGRGLGRRYLRSVGGVRFGVGLVLASSMMLLAVQMWILAAFRIRVFVEAPEWGWAF